MRAGEVVVVQPGRVAGRVLRRWSRNAAPAVVMAVV
jgi:hypothetical protein